MNKYTPGALHAAKELRWLDGTANEDYIAEIIDHKTGLPELLEALETLANWKNGLIDWDAPPAQSPELERAIKKARAAIAKAKGEPK